LTEAGWLDETDPRPMLVFLADRVSPRQLRLFACACCHSIWHLFVDERSCRAVEAAELYADGRINRQALASARDAFAAYYPTERRLYQVLADAVWFVTADEVDVEAVLARVAGASALYGTGRSDDRQRLREESRIQAGLLREIIGNPFRPVVVDPSWLLWNGGTVRLIAKAIDEEGAYDRLPILADALEEAGCPTVALLQHCRGGSVHVRGCWAVDLLLGLPAPGAATDRPRS
jgi:hypothetical protein